jgi:hypothetical protein
MSWESWPSCTITVPHYGSMYQTWAAYVDHSIVGGLTTLESLPMSGVQICEPPIMYARPSNPVPLGNIKCCYTVPRQHTFQTKANEACRQMGKERQLYWLTRHLQVGPLLRTTQVNGNSRPWNLEKAPLRFPLNTRPCVCTSATCAEPAPTICAVIQHVPATTAARQRPAEANCISATLRNAPAVARSATRLHSTYAPLLHPDSWHLRGWLHHRSMGPGHPPL